MWPTARPTCSTCRRSRRSRTMRERSRSGTCRTAPGRSRSDSTPPVSTSRSDAPTSTSTRAPARPAFLYVAAEHQATLRQPVWGWLGRDDPFAMAPGFTPPLASPRCSPGLRRCWPSARCRSASSCSPKRGWTPSGAKGVALGEYAIALADAWLSPRGARVASPRQSDRRGSHVAVAHPDARALCRAADLPPE